MKNICYKYKEHPGDLFRNTDITMLPNPEEDLEGFLVGFLKHYQSDERVTLIDDLYRLLDAGILGEGDKTGSFKIIGNMPEQKIREEIYRIEIELKNEAYANFYHLVRTKKIRIIDNGKEQ